MNTHKQKEVKNIKMFLTLAEETSSETKKSGNIFTPVNSSNTFYFDSIRPKGTVNKALRLYVVPEAQPKTYTLTVNFEYEDAKGAEYTATELLGINVKQMTELQIDDFSIPEQVEQGMPVTVGFSYYNTGKVAANEIYGGPAIVIDYGTANTFEVINEKSEFITGFITPGISSCAEALYQKAAQLPKIEIKAPKSIIAKNTVDSFQAGLVLGHIGQTKYIIEQLKEKLNLPNMKVIATGGLARVIDPKGEIFDVLDPVLTLKGLRILYEKNK